MTGSGVIRQTSEQIGGLRCANPPYELARSECAPVATAADAQEINH
jgi:hypothetical protein